jgi:hydroxymethylpyrimidine pyrophosphatase-like HAD family hydrolase
VSTDEGAEPPERASPAGRTEWLLVTDVDGTLTGDQITLADLLDALTGRVSVILNSSRPVDSVRRTLVGFPGRWMPDGIIGGLGTEMELGGDPDRMWNRRWAGWDRRPVDAVMRRLGFEPHGAEYQTAAKASFAVPVAARDTARRALDEAGVEASVLVSGESDFDVVPPGAGKGPAARHAAARLGFDEDRVATAGDAVIDADLLGFGHGILVGNADAEAVAAVGGDVFRAQAPHAAGVAEGLRAVGALGVRARR